MGFSVGSSIFGFALVEWVCLAGLRCYGTAQGPLCGVLLTVFSVRAVLVVRPKHGDFLVQATVTLRLFRLTSINVIWTGGCMNILRSTTNVGPNKSTLLIH